MHRPQLSALLLPLLAAPASVLASLDCSKLRVDKHTFDLSELDGPHSVVTSRWEPNPPAYFNTTYTINPCRPLGKSGKSKEESCPNGTRVCAIQRLLKGDINTVTEVIAIAGALENAGGSVFDYDVTRLKTSDSTGDSQKEGVRLVLKGGKHPLSDHAKDQREQKAIIEFICSEKTGLEGEWESQDKYEMMRREEEKEKGDTDQDKDKDKDKNDEGGGGDDGKTTTKEHQLMHKDAALIWDSYGAEKDADVLRLTWYTKHACEKRSEGGEEGDASSHWGFFTWFVIIVFLGIAAYLIFGSWLNYNRYGARGWDLLPHGDTIRDIPYLLKDWLRRVLNTVQGTGSRGGYSAV